MKQKLSEQESELNTLRKRVQNMEAESTEHVHHIDLQERKIETEQKKITHLQETVKNNGIF